MSKWYNVLVNITSWLHIKTPTMLSYKSIFESQIKQQLYLSPPTPPIQINCIEVPPPLPYKTNLY